MDLPYRVRQFWQLLTSEPLDESGWSQIEAILSHAQARLFRQHNLADQRHAYRAMRRLREAGHDHHALLAAALLHDVGKTRCRPRIWERIVGAVVEALCPACVQIWGKGPAAGWRRPFVIRAKHAAWGATMAREAGALPLTVRLIRHHQEKALQLESAEETQLLRFLQWADDQT